MALLLTSRASSGRVFVHQRNRLWILLPVSRGAASDRDSELATEFLRKAEDGLTQSPATNSGIAGVTETIVPLT